MKIVSTLVVVFTAVLFSCIKTSYGAQSNPKPELLYIGKSDFSDCFKYICIDSSGFYYLYCDSVIDGKQRQKRVELIKYTEEKAFLYSLDTSVFNNEYDFLKESGCSISKGDLSIYAEHDHKPYEKILPLLGGCDTNSRYYKIQFINHFFEKIELDLQLQGILALLPYYIKHNDTMEIVKGCDSGYYQLMGDDKVLRIGTSIVTATKSKVIIDSTCDIEMLLFKKGKANLVDFCSYSLNFNHFHPIKRIKVKNGLLDGIILENMSYLGNETNSITVLIKNLEFEDKTTGTRHLLYEGLFYKVVKRDGF